MESLNYIYLAIITIILISNINANVGSRRFEYKYSFKPPYLAQKDGSVPFWEYGGNAIASSENVRVAPSLRSQKGAIWTKNPINFDWWDVDIAFRITGRGRVGADGLAFWYTQSKGSYDGEVFGSSDKWNGLGLFFDSFDNDNKHNNPYIMAVLNDGTKEFDHQNDGGSQLLAGCLRDFRNKPFPTRARIEYYQNTLTVLFHNGMTNNEQDFEVCLRVENLRLPKNGHFGLSAATGGLADDHDVIHFLTSSLHPPGSQPTPGQLPEDAQRIAKEFQEYQQKLEQQKLEYRKEHPDQHKDPDLDDWFETDGQRELRQIFQGQSQMFDTLRDVNKKLDEVVGRQERTMSLISQQSGGVPMVQQAGTVPQDTASLPYIDTIKRHEVDSMFNNQNKILGTAQDLMFSVNELKSKMDIIINNQAKQPTAQVQSVGYDTQSIISEMRDGLNHVKQNYAQLIQKLAEKQTCSSNCVSLIALITVVSVQMIAILGYFFYRDNKGNHAKKLF